MKRIFAILITAILLLSVSLIVMADELSPARTVVIFQVEGSNAKMTKGAEKEFNAKKGLKLYEGYTVSTGDASYVHLKLDDSSIVKLDPKSKVSISKASSNKLSVTVLSGSVTVNAEKQKAGDVTEIRAGNSALAIRGTLFTVEQIHNDTIIITMLEGSGSVNGNPLPEGSTMNILDNNEKLEKEHIIKKSEINENTSSIILRAILENSDKLEDYITQEELSDIVKWLENKEEEESKKENEPPIAEESTAYYRLELSDPIVEDKPVKKIVAYNNGVGYYTVAEAIDAALPASTVTVQTNAALTAAKTLNAGITLQVLSPATLTLNAPLTVNGTLKVDNGATIVNNNTLANNSNTTVVIEGNFYNNDTFDNTQYGKTTIASTGSFYLDEDGFFKNVGELDIDGDFSNAGAFENAITHGKVSIGATGTFHLSASGVLKHYNRFNIAGLLTGDSGGEIIINLGGVFEHPAGYSGTMLDSLLKGSYVFEAGNELSPLPVFNETKSAGYNTLKDALSNLVGDDEIRVASSFGETFTANVTIPEDVTLYICENSTLTGTKLINYGSIKASPTGYVVLNMDVENYGDITIEDCDFTIQGGSNPSLPALINGNGANRVEGNITVNNGANFVVVREIDHQYGTFNFNDGIATLHELVTNTGGRYLDEGPCIIIGTDMSISYTQGNMYLTEPGSGTNYYGDLYYFSTPQYDGKDWYPNF